MIKRTAPTVNKQKRYAAIKNIGPAPSFMQSPAPPPSSEDRRAHLTSMEMGSTCRRNPRITTVR